MSKTTSSLALAGAAAAIAGLRVGAPSAFVSSNPASANAAALDAKAHLRASSSAAAPEAMTPSSMSVATAASAALLAGSAAASLVSRRGCAVKDSARVVSVKAFEGELGVQAPVGFWDPLGLSKDGDVGTFKRRRSVEIKHGRVCMLATMGYITPEVAGKWPGYLSTGEGLKFSAIPNGLGAISKVPLVGWLQILFYCGFVEYKGGFEREWVSGTPGDFGWKPPLLASADPATRARRLNAEIANGRLAMMAIIGMFFQDGLTGSAWGDWANYTGSPLRAFETELGVQAPVGFWDPAGLSKDGDVAEFKRRRETEIKHGRVSMWACLGYITPEYFKWPGYCSPSSGLKFADIPNGLAAVSKVPAAGWSQMFLFAGLLESGVFVYDESRGPGDYARGGVLGVPNGGGPITDTETRKRKLNAEMANGRLAMMAIIGMFYQDGLTGSAWGDWSLYTDSPLRAFESELGVQAPVGFWDPLGLSKDGDLGTFKRRRSVEIKHGRICMLATMGYITPEVAGKWPGYLSTGEGLKFDAIPNGLGAISKVPLVGWLQVLFYCGFVEYKGGFEREWVEGTPGDFGWKPPLLAGGPPETRTRRLNAEIANGRLAMMAIIGMFFQDGLTGSAWGDWANYTGSPLRAFESELGVQAPVGFWDPAGFTKDGDDEFFKRRREVELKHGRVAMFATLGYIVPDYFRFPGYLSPSAGLTFKEMPNGLEAIGKVPFLGIAQWVVFCGLVDAGLYRSDASRAPGDYENAGILGVPNASGPMADEEGRKTKLNAELANGRLAMTAIMGMFFQNGVTGGAGPEMWGFQ